MVESNTARSLFRPPKVPLHTEMPAGLTMGSMVVPDRVTISGGEADTMTKGDIHVLLFVVVVVVVVVLVPGLKPSRFRSELFDSYGTWYQCSNRRPKYPGSWFLGLGKGGFSSPRCLVSCSYSLVVTFLPSENGGLE
ncbi:hypothetical protein QBC47DRAFT_465218 [Echria macrotheca]|uniref:Uncharacterized protein n=1 Tax=Echria macrotheca TaxID=438768 RepID=A0AAJ0F6B0_9PEZI|nr:hypothetical protein QBC47DRAFT_465218 [Echria macrotheca]